MKSPLRNIPFGKCMSLVACALMLFAFSALAQTGGNKTFPGNGNTGFGGPIGTSTLQITDDTTNVTCTLTVTEGNTGGNVLVLYIQSSTNGGFSDTSGFTDTSDGIHQAISGYSGSQRSTMTFLSGFKPSYAVGVDLGNFAGVYGLANNTSLSYLGSANLNPSSGTTAGTYTFTFSLAQIGMTNGPAVVGQTFQVFGTFVSGSGYRSTECVAGNDTGTQGWNPFTQTAGGTYTVGEVPAISYPVTFQVDMTAMLNVDVFDPGNGDTVQVSGTFNNNASGLDLSPETDTNVYAVTYNDSNSLGTVETFSYTIIHGGGGSVPETTDARTFTVTNTQTLPVWYFSSFAPDTNATVPLTFSVDMSVQIAAGSFNPAVDSVYAYGDFNENAGLTWGPSTPLTPSETNTNVYVGTFGDGNYVGTPCQYKFVRYSSALSEYIYESRPNRQYTTPASAETFPTVYFNDATNVTVVTFTVDMSAQTYFGKFTPGSDTIAVAGSFTGWAPGIACTNDPNNTNFYQAAIPIFDAPGTTEQFKFITYGTGISGTDYESPASSTPTIGGNRYLVLPSTDTNLPVVAFSDQYLSDYLLTNTTVVFTVNMTNAEQYPSGPAFNPTSDSVYINGDFLGWPTWATTLPQMAPEGTNLVYTYSNVFNAGSPVVVNYKYGIDGSDNEAGFGQNHVRYIRGYGTYYMPMDTFGNQVVEQSFGNLAIAQPSGGHVPITWLGRPGVHLQVSSNVNGPWVDHPETDALSSTNWPLGGSSLYFRLVHPEQ